MLLIFIVDLILHPWVVSVQCYTLKLFEKLKKTQGIDNTEKRLLFFYEFKFRYNAAEVARNINSAFVSGTVNVRIL